MIVEVYENVLDYIKYKIENMSASRKIVITCVILGIGVTFLILAITTIDEEHNYYPIVMVGPLIFIPVVAKLVPNLNYDVMNPNRFKDISDFLVGNLFISTAALPIVHYALGLTKKKHLVYSELFFLFCVLAGVFFLLTANDDDDGYVNI